MKKHALVRYGLVVIGIRIQEGLNLTLHFVGTSIFRENATLHFFKIPNRATHNCIFRRTARPRAVEIFKTIFPTNRYICIFGILSEGVTVKIIISIIFLTDRLIVNPLVNCWPGHKLNFGEKKENQI